MNFTELNEVFPTLLDLGHSMELISAPGRGKSDFVDQQVSANSQRVGSPFGFASCFLATMTPSDLLGYMVPGIDAKNRRRSEFTAPPWMYTAEGGYVEDYSRGILFLDEYGQGEADVKRASAELLLNKKLGPWKLPKGWSVIAASNRVKDRSGVTKSFDFVINRRIQILIDDDIQAWENWAVEHRVDPMIIHYAINNLNIVFSDGVPAEQGPWCTPRSLVKASEVLNARRGNDMLAPLPDDNATMQLVMGWIGEAATHQLFATVKLANNMPKYSDIVSDPANCKIPEAPDAMMLVAYTVAARAELEDMGKVVQYMARFPIEFVVLWFKAQVKYKPMATKDPAFAALYMKNAALMNSVISSTAR